MRFQNKTLCQFLVTTILFFGLAGCGPEEDAESVLSGVNLDNGSMIFDVAHCTGCHNTADDPETGRSGYMAGGDFLPGIYSANATQDVETGIGGWSDEEIEAVLRTGERPDGTIVHGIMPFSFLRNLTKSDMRDLIAHLRTIPAVRNVVPRSGGDNMLFEPDLFADFPAPPTADEVGEQIARGAYLATVAHCMGCHTYRSTDGSQDYKNQMGNGGMVFDGPFPAVSANITPHMEDGIGSYSIEDIVHIFRTGTRPDGSELAPIMGTRDLEHLPQSDLEAIAAYLKWLEPKPSPVPED